MTLALKYRPKRFVDLIGQDHCVFVLKAILRKYFNGTGGLPAGFLFSGTKGTGKTSSARVVASILNCQSEYVGDPKYDIESCCECENCLSIANSNCIFVHEIDAASSGSVEHIRKIKDWTTLTHGGKVRVIILDEAHSLSSSAFEALLKQLEEPMPNVLYIMCTTEEKKFPETILSRLMQFNFKQLNSNLITTRLHAIAVAEDIKVGDSKVLPAIAVRSQGAMRDAIMTMEQLSNYKSPMVLDDFLSYYGLVNSEVAHELIRTASKVDIVRAKEILSQNFTKIVDMPYFLDNLMIQVTDSLYQKLLTPQQVIEIYKAAVEVKSKLKYMSIFVAANYLFALLLRVFSYEGQQVSATMDKGKLEEMFQ